MTDIRKSLNSLADAIEAIENRPAPSVELKDRELSGNKINGGRITNFASMGISDQARDTVLTLTNDKIITTKLEVPVICNPLTVQGNLTVDGEITASKLHVDELSADIRNERTSSLEFQPENGSLIGKGLIWTGGKYTKQFVLQGNADRLWSSEDIDLRQDKSYRINNITVISSDTLGKGVVNSNLRTVGTLQELDVEGSVNIDYFVRYDANSRRVSIGSDDPTGMLTIESLDHQFIVDPTDDRRFKIGTYTTGGLDIITDDTARISIAPSGSVTIKTKTNFTGKVGIGVNNFVEDVDLTVAGSVRIQNKKFEVADGAPTTGSYVKGDIVWNTNPQPTGYVGWVCIKTGQPGQWKPFGQISA